MFGVDLSWETMADEPDEHATRSAYIEAYNSRGSWPKPRSRWPNFRHGTTAGDKHGTDRPPSCSLSSPSRPSSCPPPWRRVQYLISMTVSPRLHLRRAHCPAPRIKKCSSQPVNLSPGMKRECRLSIVFEHHLARAEDASKSHR